MITNQKSKIDIFKELNLENLSEEKKKELIEKVFRAVHIKVIERALDFLTEDEQMELDKMRQEGSSEQEIENFLESKIPSFEVIAKAELKALLATLKKEVKRFK